MQCISSLQCLSVRGDPTVPELGADRAPCIYTLIIDYRERKKIMLNVEHRLIL